MGDALKEDVEFLKHYGTKGMRWGVRKRRNESARAKKFNATNRAKKLSDADLKTAIERMDLEKKYVDLSRGTSGAGKKYTREIIENSGKTVAGAVVGGVTGHLVKRALTKG